MMDRLMQVMLSGMLVLVVPAFLVCLLVTIAAWRRRHAPNEPAKPAEPAEQVPNETSIAPVSPDR